MRIKRSYLFFLLVFFLFSSVSVHAAKLEQLLLVVPEISDQAPSPEFFSIIHSSVSYLDKTSRVLGVNIVSKDPLACDYAKIVLHSYGFKNGQVKILKSLGLLKFNDLQDLRVFGSLSLNDQDYLTRHGVVLDRQGSTNSPIVNSGADGVGRAADLAIIVLGTAPLDETTPSLDMVKRVGTAIRLLEKDPQAICIFSGGRTAGIVSEAKMMSLIALSRGIPSEKFLLEEGSRSTIENAQFTARLVRNLSVKRFILVSRPTHLKRAMAIFKSHQEFKELKVEPTDVTREEIEGDLTGYLAFNPSARVRAILNKIMKELHD